MSTSKPGKIRIGELDALRGLAALAVMIFHYTGHYGKNVGHVDRPLFELALGNYGVQLFFMISGFVIFMTIEKTRTAMDFVVTRFSRLFPAYWASIAIAALFVYTIGMPSQQLPVADLVANVTMVQGLLHFRHLDGSYWTLQVELLFYAQILFWFMVGQVHRVHWIIAGWLALAMAYQIFAKFGVDLSWTLGQLLILEHIPFFSMGILFYKMYTTNTGNRLNHLMIAACIAVIAFTHPPVYLTVAAVCTAVFYLFIHGRMKWLQFAPFMFFGTISYTVYLLHQAIGVDIIWHLEHDLHAPSNFAIVAAIVVSLLLATLVTYTVERPAMTWIRERWQQWRRRARAPQNA